MTKEEKRVKHAVWREANREHVRRQSAASYARRRDAVRARARAKYAADPEHRAKRAAYHREHHAANREKLNAYHRRRKAEARLLAFSHYGPEGKPICAWCGIADLDVLTLDHIDNSGAKHRQSEKKARAIVFWVVRQGLPPGFQTLCMNCNYKKHLLSMRASAGDTTSANCLLRFI